MIEIQNLSFGYAKNKPVFKNLNLSLKAGNIYGLLGENGAGKSSLMKIMAGLLFPQEGSCVVEGYRAQHREPGFLREMFFLPEEFHVSDLPLKDFVRTNAPFYPNFSQEQFQLYLKEFNIAEAENLSKLSYGQKKKVLIAFGIATNTHLLIMDEPTNGLDIPSKSQFRKVIASAIDENRVIIISTHQVRDLSGLIDPIIVIDQQEIIFNELLDDVSEKLSFRLLTKITEEDKVLYSEHSLKGTAAVLENTTGDFTKVDLELLFNAVLANKGRIREIFSDKKVAEDFQGE